MKIVIINGSARKGNTLAVIDAFASGAETNNTVEVIHADQLKLTPCKGCNACQMSKGCVAKDDTNETVDKLVAADMIVFASPVYWWGISGQLKLVIDKCYSKGRLLKGKKIGVIIVGGDGVESVQYSLIKTQFECMAKFLNWNIVFHKSFSANGATELSQNGAVLQEMKAIGAMM